jgi:undecaprenyl diphosphate synthase
MMASSDTSQVLPNHVAIIMDGNRRWAKAKHLPALYGHDHVANKVIEPLVEHCIAKGVKYLTLWAFSTENWRREADEVTGLMGIFRQAFTKSAARLHQQGVRLNTIGDLAAFPADIQANVTQWLADTANNTNITVTFALNYGGRDEIVRAVQAWLKHQTQTKEQPEQWQLTDEVLAKYLDTAQLPDPDLVIRPGGELRLSGFLSWQSVYAELYFTDVLMPDFSPAELDKALEEYARRQRRFGS